MRAIVVSTGAQRCDAESVSGGGRTDRTCPDAGKADPAMTTGALPLALLTAIVSSICGRAVAAAADGYPVTTTPRRQNIELCDDYYEGVGGRPRDFARALDCYRRHEQWLSVAIMQVNGEGTAIDLAAARDSLSREMKNADTEALEAIIRRREARPTAKSRRVDFCKDVATITTSVDACSSSEVARKTAKADVQLSRLRNDVDPRARPAFDRVRSAFNGFVKSEGE